MIFSTRHFGSAFFALAVLFGFQFGYFARTMETVGTDITGDFDLVLTYSDSNTLEPALALALSHHKPLYVSQAPWEPRPFRKHPPADLAEVDIDPAAATTDQNARRAALFIRKGGYKRVVLDVSWFHVPRALFLTRFYLMGSGVAVIPCAETPVPPRWWASPAVRKELFKFWGSLGRVLLNFFGWETGPHAPKNR